MVYSDCIEISGIDAVIRVGELDALREEFEKLALHQRAQLAERRQKVGHVEAVKELRNRRFSASKKRVERLMRENGIHARHKRRYKVTTDSKHTLPVADNLLARNFTPTAPNQVWTSDITCLWTEEGWLYLAIVLDLFNREAISWSIKPRMTDQLMSDALTITWFGKRPAPTVLPHLDRGNQ